MAKIEGGGAPQRKKSWLQGLFGATLSGKAANEASLVNDLTSNFNPDSEVEVRETIQGQESLPLSFLAQFSLNEDVTLTPARTRRVSAYTNPLNDNNATRKRKISVPIMPTSTLMQSNQARPLRIIEKPGENGEGIGNSTMLLTKK